MSTIISTMNIFFFSSRRRHTRWPRDWSSDVCSSDLKKLGLRMMLKTVNQDDPGSYQLYYSNADCDPGSIISFFPWPGAMQGRSGRVDVINISFSVPETSFDFWTARFVETGIQTDPLTRRFGKKVISFRDPDNLALELVFDAEAPAQTSQPAKRKSREEAVADTFAIRGIWGSTISLVDPGPAAEALELFGFSQVDREDRLTRFRSGAEIGHSIILQKLDSPVPSLNGRSIVHHIAFRARDEDELESLREQALNTGLSPSSVIERHIYKSVYVPIPGGVLFEIATDEEDYASVSEASKMGKTLFLPPWLEESRDGIERSLPGIHI